MAQKFCDQGRKTTFATQSGVKRTLIGRTAINSLFVITSGMASMATDHIDFWFTMGSTYSYLSVMRLGEVAKTAGVTFRWRPFANVRALTGATQVPFPDGASKTRYMWRDIERRAAIYGIPLRLPVPYPISNSRATNCVALLGMHEGWGEQFVYASYRHWFQQGEENGGEPNLRASLAECGQDFDRVVTQAKGDKARHDLDRETDEARGIGVFGSPSFVVGGEVFWGDDRLEDAISWYRYGCARSLADTSDALTSRDIPEPDSLGG